MSVVVGNNFEKSDALFKRAIKRIPLAAQTFSKSHLQLVKGASPLFVSRGHGARVWDVDEQEYVDLVNGLASIILGYGDDDVNNAVRDQLERGVSFSLATELEVECAELLSEYIPSAEMVRFAKNGSDVTSAAIRVARAFTGRDHVAVCGYHGWHDWYIGSTARHKGVPAQVRELTHTFSYNNLPSLEKIFKEKPGNVAAVIMEPTIKQAPNEGFLASVKELARQNGALLIFDEIVTGFRWHCGGAQAYFGVTPDLATFGKAMGNGFPIAAIVGQARYMNEIKEIFFSSTFGGEALSLAATIATIKKVRQENVPGKLWKLGGRLMEEVSRLIERRSLQDLVQITGQACLPWLDVKGGRGEDEWTIKSFIRQEMISRGILVFSSHNLSYAHSEADIQKVVEAYNEVFESLGAALAKGSLEKKLRGEKMKPIFQVRSS